MGGPEGRSHQVWSSEILCLEILGPWGVRPGGMRQALRAPVGEGPPPSRPLPAVCHHQFPPRVTGPHRAPSVPQVRTGAPVASPEAWTPSPPRSIPGGTGPRLCSGFLLRHPHTVSATPHFPDALLVPPLPPQPPPRPLLSAI